MSKFSTTRLADRTTALGANAFLEPAIQWLRNNTDMGRFSDLEVYEIIQAATASGGFAITFNTHSIP